MVMQQYTENSSPSVMSAILDHSSVVNYLEGRINVSADVDKDPKYDTVQVSIQAADVCLVPPSWTDNTLTTTFNSHAESLSPSDDGESQLKKRGSTNYAVPVAERGRLFARRNLDKRRLIQKVSVQLFQVNRTSHSKAEKILPENSNRTQRITHNPKDSFWLSLP